jgi:tetratricopeptide (TPR) repeat protein
MPTYDQRGQHINQQINIAVTNPQPATRPLQRPPRAEHFTGREKELAQLLADLQPSHVITLCGPGGIGKTALAAEALWTLAPGDTPPDRFPDGLIFHSFYNQPQAALALEAIARAFGEEPKPTPRDAAQRVLANRQALLVLDGAEAADDLPAVLDIRGNCGVLVTSRQRKDATAERQDLTPLPLDKAISLLQAWGGNRATDQDAAHQICDLVGGLPLAVRLVGRYLTQVEEEAVDYLQWLQETPLQALDLGRRRQESVVLLLERSLGQVGESARQVLAVASWLALAPFDREVVTAALAVSPGQTGRWLAELVSYGLLLREDNRYAVSHALIYTYARRRLVLMNETFRRLATYYINLATEQSDLGLAGYAHLDPERTHLMSILRCCIEQKMWEAGRTLAWVVSRFGGYLAMQGYQVERMTAIEAGLVASRTLGDRKTEGVMLGDLGDIYRNQGQVERALEYYEQALTLARELGDRQVEAASISKLGFVYQHRLNQIERAIEYHELSLNIAREIGSRGSESINLDNLGNAYRALGQVERGLEYCEQALALAREIGFRQGERNALSSLGIAYRNLGQVERTLEYYEQALTISREIGNRGSEAIDLGNLAVTYQTLGQVERAIECYQQALSLAREIGNRHDEANWTHMLGELYKDQQNLPLAQQHLKQALAIYEDLNSPRSEQVRNTLTQLEAS